jgi:hypothetical protein
MLRYAAGIVTFVSSQHCLYGHNKRITSPISNGCALNLARLKLCPSPIQTYR